MRVRSVALLVFFCPDGTILLQDRRGMSKRGEEWGFFGGGIEEGETPEAAVRREISEELSVTLADVRYLGENTKVLDGDLRLTRHVFIAPVADFEGRFEQRE